MYCEITFNFVFDSLVRDKVLLVEDIINPNHTLVYFRMAADFSGFVIRPEF